jgi:predicted alpha/beta-fold hydrolase
MAQRPRVVCQMNPFNQGVLSRMPTIRSVYEPLMFLTNGHIETIFAAKVRARIALEYKREYLLVPEGGVIALDWKERHPDDPV